MARIGGTVKQHTLMTAAHPRLSRTRYPEKRAARLLFFRTPARTRKAMMSGRFKPRSGASRLYPSYPFRVTIDLTDPNSIKLLSGPGNPQKAPSSTLRSATPPRLGPKRPRPPQTRLAPRAQCLPRGALPPSALNPSPQAARAPSKAHRPLGSASACGATRARRTLIPNLSARWWGNCRADGGGMGDLPERDLLPRHTDAQISRHLEQVVRCSL